MDSPKEEGARWAIEGSANRLMVIDGLVVEMSRLLTLVL